MVLLEKINSPEDLKALKTEELEKLCVISCIAWYSVYVFVRVGTPYLSGYSNHQSAVCPL